MSFRNMWNRLIKNENGNFAIMGAVAFLSLMLITGLATDSQNLVNKQQRLQSASDAIALAAYQSGAVSQSELQAIAAEYLENTYSANEGAGLSVANIRRVDNRVVVTLAHDLSESARFFIPRSNPQVSASSEAGNDSEAINIALVLDTTESMTGNRINTLKSASGRLLDQLEMFDNDDLKVSVVPFGQYVNVGTNYSAAPWLDVPEDQTQNRCVSSVVTGTRSCTRDGRQATCTVRTCTRREQRQISWTGCVGSRNGTLETNPDFDGARVPGLILSCGTQMQPLTNNIGTVRSKIQSLSTRGETYLPSGLMWGWRTLDQDQPLTEASVATVNEDVRKVMIFMTDGENTKSKSGTRHNGSAAGQTDLKTAQICQDMKAEGVEVFSIAYEVTDNATRQLLESCASSLSQYFDAQNDAQLVQAFEDIGASLGSLRLTN